MGRSILLLLFTFLHSQVILNEIMVDPENDNTGEFIEIYNIGDSTIDIREYYICDAQDTDAVLAFPDSFLLSGEYGLILDPDYTGEYNDLIPDSIPLFTIPDSRFGKYGISNSTPKPFSLLDRQGSIVDSYITGTAYWPESAHTIERNSFYNNIWNESLEIDGTPGFKNSTAIKDYDILIHDLSCTHDDSLIYISFSVINTGLLQINKYSFGYIMDIPCADKSLNDTLISSSNAPVIPGDSILVSFEHSISAKGGVFLHVFAFLDDNISDTLTTETFIPISENELLITEFVSKTGDYFTVEYIELLSKSNRPIQLYGLQIHDLTGHTAIDSYYVLSPDSLIVLAQSASFRDDHPFASNYIIPPAWRSLNNSEDVIRLTNPSGSLIINLQYNADWDIPSDCAMQLVDTALNYNDPGNWEISYTGSPGKFNITEKQLRHLSFRLEKDFFSPLDTLHLAIINDGYFPVEESQFSFATPVAEQIIVIPHSEPGDTIYCEIDTTELFLEGTNECTLELACAHERQPEINHIKYYYPLSNSPLFFNEIMFDPIDTYGQSEFIELECIHKPLDLEKWKIRVNNSTFELGDSLFNTYTAICDIDDPVEGISTSARKTFSRFPSLPNAGAELFLLDPMDHVMDYVDLRDHSEIREGKSIEKQFLSISSNDLDLWFSSVSNAGMTPGSLNSITSLPGMRYDIDIYPEIFDPTCDNFIQFSIDSEIAIEYCELYCFNTAGQCIYQHHQNVFSNPSFIHYWNGEMKNGKIPSRGLYMVLIILHQIDGNIHKLREIFAIK